MQNESVIIVATEQQATVYEVDDSKLELKATPIYQHQSTETRLGLQQPDHSVCCISDSHLGLEEDPRRSLRQSFALAILRTIESYRQKNLNSVGIVAPAKLIESILNCANAPVRQVIKKTFKHEKNSLTHKDIRRLAKAG